MPWRLVTIARYMERDGGVYLEIEAIGLSRDIPGSVRWFVEPIVRNVSRQSLKHLCSKPSAEFAPPASNFANSKLASGS